jgi:Kef-type K+ transport system membrane component KefB
MLKRSHFICLLFAAAGLWLLVKEVADAQPALGGHNDPIAPVILGVTGILFFAILGRFIARQLNQPSVLGEVLIGIVIGVLGTAFGFELIIVLREGPAVFDVINLALSGEPLDAAAREVLGGSSADSLLAVLQGPDGGIYMGVAHTVDVFSRYGVIFLLFLVGLQSSVDEMRTVGFEAGRVAVLGVILPFVLGFASMRLLAPEVSLNTDMFVAATLGATSVGITAEVLRELGRETSKEGHIILGAAVIDDILGLMTLAVVSGIIVSGGVVIGNVLFIIVLATAFLAGAVYLGPYILRLTVKVLGRLDIVEAKMFTSFMFVMVLAWLANLMGLATIVGAFTAGVILHEGYFEDLTQNGDHISIRELIMPLEVILVPIFFVLMGIQVKLESFLDPAVLITASGLLVAAMLGKIISGWGAGSGTNRWLIGFGMMPRGEVGLIFASIGKSLGVITDALFSAVVLMVIVTTLAAPPLIKLVTRLDSETPAR